MKPEPTSLRRRHLLLAWPLAAALPARAHGDAHQPAAPKARDDTQHAWGREGDPRRVQRTVHIGMSDRMRFTPDKLQLRSGQTLRLVVHNRGQMLHELVLGTREELQAHAELMKKHPGMEHDAPYMAHVAAGEQAQIVWQFNRPGRFLYGCLVAGHWDAGMLGHIEVRP